MRFNDVTRQSVAKVWLAQLPDGTASLEMQPDCLAMEYLKTMASAGDLLAVNLSHNDAGCMTAAVKRDP